MAAQRFRYQKAAIFKDYGQAAAGASIFGIPLLFAGGNIYLLAILGGFVALFVGFGVATWRRHKSVIVVTDDAIASEGAKQARITWAGTERVELRYFSNRRGMRAREERNDGERGWMQLRVDGDGATLRIDSNLENFDQVAKRVADAVDRYDLATAHATKSNFAALGMAPDPAWAEEY